MRQADRCRNVECHYVDAREIGLSQSWLLWGILFGSVGLGYFLYGKREKAVVPMVCGLLLMIFPYFVEGTIPLVGIGIALAVIPYFVRL